MKFFQRSILAVGIACGNFISLAQQPTESGTSPANGNLAQASANTLQISDLVIVDDEVSIIRKQLAQKIDDLVSKQSYTGLDELANTLRKSKIHAANGTWHLLLFYRLLSYEWSDTSNVPDEHWKTRLDFLKSWVNTTPSSITARVALARYYKNAAWKSRGLGYANTVTKEGWQVFAEQMALTKQTLLQAATLETKCPVWWDTMQNVEMGQEFDMASSNKLFADAVAFEPNYITFYILKAQELLPRWHGQEGDWEKFAMQSADAIGGEAGDILYARIGWRMHERRFYKSFLKETGYSWPRMKKGLEAIIKQYPDSLSAVSELAYLARQSKDRECAKPLFERLGKNVDHLVWYDDKARFLADRTWVFKE